MLVSTGAAAYTQDNNYIRMLTGSFENWFVTFRWNIVN